MRNGITLAITIRRFALEVLKHLFTIGDDVNRILKTVLLECRSDQENIVRAIFGQQNIFEIAHSGI